MPETNTHPDATDDERRLAMMVRLLANENRRRRAAAVEAEEPAGGLQTTTPPQTVQNPRPWYVAAEDLRYPDSNWRLEVLEQQDEWEADPIGMATKKIQLEQRIFAAKREGWRVKMELLGQKLEGLMKELEWEERQEESRRLMGEWLERVRALDPEMADRLASL